MTLALRILVTALLVGLLAVPAASAKPGGGKSHGQGAEKAKAAHEHKAGKERGPRRTSALGPGQYCHQLEAWMAANDGNFSQSFGTEGSGYANDHGKCASRRAHGEDLAPAALQSVCDAAKAAGGELPEACKPAEELQTEQAAPAAAGLSTVLRLLSF